jgi:hypothetical protein
VRNAETLVDKRPLQAVQGSGFVDAIAAQYPASHN